MQISSLSLSAFRNYTQLALRDMPAGLIAFTGANGAGKTNILEAISLLSPGRGLRNAEASELQSRNTPHTQMGWSIHARLGGEYGQQDLGIGIDPMTGKRLTRLNGETLKNSTDRGELFTAIWLTPAQDRLFLDAAGSRRRFLDRWVFTADPAHAGRISRMERLLSERNRLLSLTAPDPIWLDALEQDLSETAIAVAIARNDYVAQLSNELATADDTYHFPRPTLRLSGFLEDRIGIEPSLAIETDYRTMLVRNRARDAAIGATTIGAHRSDLLVGYAAKNMPAHACSTGEQKALLFSLFLAHTRLLARKLGTPPVLLLDEIAAHLDPDRRTALLAELSTLGAQTFMTATTADCFAQTPAVHIVAINNGSLTKPSHLKVI